MNNDMASCPARGPNQQTGQSIILGIGTGQCGMRALAELLNHQSDTRVTHEQPPLMPWRPDRGRPTIRERLCRLRASRPHRFTGDVGAFYLPYVEEAISLEPDLRVICLKRPRAEVVAGFCCWLDTAHPLPTNHWSDRPSDGWHHDLIWTRTFPQYQTQDREDGVGRYWDEYYERVDDLVRRFPDNVRVFLSSESLGTESGMRDLLTFAGIPEEIQIPLAIDWVGTDLPARPHPRRAASSSADLRDPRRCVVLVPHMGSILSGCDAALRGLERRGYEVWRVGGFAAIDEGRSHLATAAMIEGFEETMWVDADIEFDPEAVDRLRSRGEPVVCGIYAQKSRRALSCHAMPGTEKFVFGEEGGLAEILYAAGGFLLVRRQVYLDIQRRLDLPVCNERFGRPMIPFFQPMVRPYEDGTWYLPEDYAFCERVRQCGYRVLADTTIRLWHLGQYSYSWEDAITDQKRYENASIFLEKSVE